MSAAARVFSSHINCPSSENERITILQWFSDIPYRGHHDLAREGRVAGTGQWLFQRKEFKHWQQSEESEILWLHGIRKSQLIYMNIIIVYLLTLYALAKPVLGRPSLREWSLHDVTHVSNSVSGQQQSTTSRNYR